MRVLITVGALGHVAGTQAYVRDLASWLLAQGHRPVVYGPHHGRTAAQLARLTIPVTDDLSTVSVVPDVIHGNSAIETMTALLHFTDTPAIFVCHGWRADLIGAPRFPRILQYVAVDDTCADRLLLQEGVPPDRVAVLFNGVDLSRFPARTAALPPRPRRALVFSNGAHAASHVLAIREACGHSGIALDVVGELAGNALDAPEAILGDYDLVFAKARSALEAMACGAAVILCEGADLGGMVTSTNVESLRRLNFGIRARSGPATVDAIAREIASYDGEDAASVSRIIRETASSELLHAQLMTSYEAVIAEYAAVRNGPAAWLEDSRAAAAFLRLVAGSRRPSDAKLNLVVQAANRILQAPLIGQALTRIARWIVDRGRDDWKH